MQQTESTKLLYALEAKPVVDSLTELQSGLECLPLESLEDLLNAPSSEFHYRPTLEEAVWHPVLVLHSSGSTGIPKPVIMRHGSFTVMDNDRNFPSIPGRKNHDLTVWDFDGFSRARIYEPFPPFHLTGFFNKVMIPLFTNAVPVFGPPLRPPSGSLVAEIMRKQKIRGCILPPSLVEQLLCEPDGLDLIRQLRVFCYAGGPLSEAAGNAISKATLVCQFYGSTEIGQVRQLVPQREEWSYMEFHPLAKLEFERYDKKSFELVLFLDDDEHSDSMALKYNYPGVKVWHSKDLFEPHPAKSGLWRFYGRTDDILVLSNGEKLNPVPMENQLQGSQNISGALVVGQGQIQPMLLLEIRQCGTIDEMWPMIEEANQRMPSHGRITRSMILLAKAEKPFIRAGKGSVVRKLTENLYADEVANFYKDKDSFVEESPVLTATLFTLEAISTMIALAIPLNIVGQDWTKNLYTLGMDSLKTTEALKSVRAALRPHRTEAQISWLSMETFYQYPSISQLSQVILDFLNNGELPHASNKLMDMAGMLDKYTRSLSPAVANTTKAQSNHLSIVISGTTGWLGGYLVEEYVRQSNVSNIICLNRSLEVKAKEQWDRHCRSRDFACEFKSTKMEFLTADFGQSQFGLDQETWSRICECDLIVHSAWRVDFNMALASFEDNIQSVQTVCNMSASNVRRPRIAFVSSISSVGPWNRKYSDEGIPETAIQDFNAALDIGYGQSKNVAERILEQASTAHDIPVSIFRIGQIGGPSEHSSKLVKWPPRDSVPAMLRTSEAIGCVPNDLPSVDWIPVNVVAKILIEVTLYEFDNSGVDNLRHYNVVNPRPVDWSKFLDLSIQKLGPDIQAVPLSRWVENLYSFDRTDLKELLSKPALKTRDFFALMASNGATTRFQTGKCAVASTTMASLPPADEALMQEWLEQCLG